MTTPQEGYLVIADITGYTAFLSQSELEHAEDSLRNLLDLLLEHTRPPLVLSRLEGDAVISYAPDGSFLQGQTLVETIEGTYAAFKQALDLMMLNTNCDCNACRLIPNLDLKFFVHYGTFMLQQFPSYTELIGSDVNLIHRLLKNSISEKMGLKAYAVYTQAAVDALDIAEICMEMEHHAESYEHLGEVTMYVQDMHAVWKRKREELRVEVRREDALLVVEKDFPLEPALMWDYLTTPEFRALLLNSDSQKVTGRIGGRTGKGSVYHCVHGKDSALQLIVDWRPFEQYTSEGPIPVPGVTVASTVRLTAIEGGTRVSYICGKSQGPQLVRQVSDVIMRRSLPDSLEKGLQTLHARITQDIADRKIVQPVAVEASSQEVDKALATSLAASSAA